VRPDLLAHPLNKSTVSWSKRADLKKAFLLLIVLSVAASNAWTQSQALEALIEKIVAPYLDKDAAKGISVGIIEGGFEYHYSFGHGSTISSGQRKQNFYCGRINANSR